MSLFNSNLCSSCFFKKKKKKNHCFPLNSINNNTQLSSNAIYNIKLIFYDKKTKIKFAC